MLIADELHYPDKIQPMAAAVALLCRVEYAASALLVFDREEVCAGLCLFDTAYGRPVLPLPAGTCAAWLMSNHPMGDDEPYKEDRENVLMLRALLGRSNVRFFLTGETVGCCETVIADDE